MKELIFGLLFSGIFLFEVNCQDNFTLRLFVTDSNNKKDTIEFGLNYYSTVGVDTLLGEQDIYGQPWDSTGIRIIQRDSLEHHCLLQTNWYNDPLAPEIYYENNMDLKKDFRPYATFGTINMSFEILVKSANPPIYVTTDFHEIAGTMFEGYSVLHLLDSNCYTVETQSIYFNELNETIYVLNDTVNTLVAEMQHEVGVKENNSEKIKIFPNPAQTEINVKADVPVIMKLYDVYGRIVAECDGNYLNIRELKNGLYIIRVFDEKGSQIKVEKIVKESGF